jgi:transposase
MISAAIERCAGIDVGKKFLAVCVMVGPLEGEPRVEIRKFGTIRAELEGLRDWLKQQGVTHAVMESTGSYWKPVFKVLEDAVRVYLANPQEVKNRKGHKTDNKDGWWLAHLLRHAMIHPSFIPPRAIRELRDLTRRRKRLLGAGTSERNRVQKVLEDANVKLGNVLTDLFGVSCQLMLEALLRGQAKPEEIAQFAKGRAKKKIPEMLAALEGHQMSDHHRRMIRYSVDHMCFPEEQIEQLDQDKPSPAATISLPRSCPIPSRNVAEGVRASHAGRGGAFAHSSDCPTNGRSYRRSEWCCLPAGPAAHDFNGQDKATGN